MTHAIGANPYPYQRKTFNPLPEILAQLKTGDLFTTLDNLRVYESLDKFYRSSLEYEIGPEYYQVLGIAVSGSNYALCKKAQILAINGFHGKVDAKSLESMNPAIDHDALNQHPRNLFLLRSIRWYLTSAYPLLEWENEQSINTFRKIEAIGHDCVEEALSKDAYWEIIQFYLTVMPFSNRRNLRDKIDSIKGHLPIEAKDVVIEQLFSLDALKMVDEVEAIDPKLPPLKAQEERERKINDRIIRVRVVLDKISGHELACRFFKEDLKIKVMTAALYLYTRAHVLGLREIDLTSYANRLLAESITAVRPSGIHVQAINVVLRANVILGKHERNAEIKTNLKALMDRIKE